MLPPGQPRSFRFSGLLLAALLGSGICTGAADRPSILLVTVDTLRADHVRPELTPNLSRLASRAVFFDNAVTVSPLTLPAHSSLLTGLLPPRHGVRDNAFFVLSEDIPRYPSRLRAEGYATAAFVSSIVLDHQFGLASGFDHYDDRFEPPERSSRETLDRAWDWIRQARTPFFAWIHLFDPHAPYDGGYAEEVGRVDLHLGRFFDRLREAGKWDGLILAVTSDHGESLGEHGEKTHGFFIYDSTLRIPLILKIPGVPATRFPFQTSLVDVMPTLLESIETGAGGGGDFLPDGRGLLAEIRSGRDPGREAYSETFLPSHQFGWSPLRSMRTDRWKFIQAPRAELYDLQADPGESSNRLAGHPEIAERLAKQLEELETGGGQDGLTEIPSLSADRFLSLGYIGSAPGPSSGGRLPADPKAKLETYLLVMDALELSETGHPAEALSRLEKAEQDDPDITQIHFLKGSILGGMGRFGEAIIALRRSVALNPRYVTGRFKLAQAYLATGQLEEAERTLQVAIQQDAKNFRALHNLAVIAVRRGDLEAAEKLERQALDLNQDYFEAWNTLGAIQISRQQAAPAREALQRALQLEPESGQAYYNLSLAERALGNSSAAAEAALKACQFDSRYCGH